MNNILDWLYKVLAVLLAIISPIHSIILATIFLVIVDYLTGIWVARKQKSPVTWYKSKRSIGKLVAYLTTVIVGFVIETYLFNEVPVMKVISSLIGLREGKSILENISLITGVDFWEAIINKVQGKPLDLSSIKTTEEK